VLGMYKCSSEKQVQREKHCGSWVNGYRRRRLGRLCMYFLYCRIVQIYHDARSTKHSISLFQLVGYLELDTSNYFLLFSQTVFRLLLAWYASPSDLRGLRRRSAAARLLGLWDRIPPGAWMFVCCECRVLSGRGLCDELITRPEESYRLWCVVECDLENSRMRRPGPLGGGGGCCAK